MKTGQILYVDEELEKSRSVSNSSCHLNRNGDHQRKTVRKQCPGHVEFLEEEEIQKDEPTSKTDASDIYLEVEDKMPSLSLVPSHYSKNSSLTTEREQTKKRRQQKTASAVVTGGALTFVVLAAIMVTASFLMSPVIEEIFGKIL